MRAISCPRADDLHVCGAVLVEVGDALDFNGCLRVTTIGDRQGVFAEDFDQFVAKEDNTGHEAVSATLDGGVDVLQRPELAAHLLDDESLLRRESTASLVGAQLKVLVDGRLQEDEPLQHCQRERPPVNCKRTGSD